MGLLVFQQSSGGTINVQGTNTASAYTWTIPASSDTFVGLAASQALTNKTIDSSAIGSTTPSTGAFTTVSASTSVTTPFVTSAASTNLLLKSAGTTAVTVDTSQNIGVGTTPTYKVDVSGAFSNDGVTPAMRLVNTSANGYANLRLQGNSRGGAVDFYSGASTAQASILVNSSMQFYMGGNGSTGTQAMTLDTSGNLLVGVTSYASTPSSGVTIQTGNNASVNVGHTSSPSGYLFVNFGYGGTQIGSITQNGTTGVLYNIASDRRLKTNIVDFTDSGKYIDGFKPRKFNWITDNSEDIGFITEEYQQTLPSAITGQPDATKEEEYEITPAVKDEQGNITTPAVMGTRTVPVYQQGDFSTSAKMAIIIAELQSLRARLKAANIA